MRSIFPHSCLHLLFAWNQASDCCLRLLWVQGDRYESSPIPTDSRPTPASSTGSETLPAPSKSLLSSLSLSLSLLCMPIYIRVYVMCVCVCLSVCLSVSSCVCVCVCACVHASADTQLVALTSYTPTSSHPLTPKQKASTDPDCKCVCNV